MFRYLLISALLASIVSIGIPENVLHQDDAKKAAQAKEILSKSREAMGCDKLKSLSVTGNYRQLLGERELSGEIELNLLLPDKFLKSTTMNMMPGVEVTRMEVLNGANAWMDMQNSAPSGGNVMIRMGPPGASSPDAQKMQQNFIRQEWARILLGFTASAPDSLQLEFSYGGEAEASDGVADMIEVKGPDNFSAQLFVDQKTHYPLMVSYKGRKPRVVMATKTMTRADGPPKQEELDKQMKEAQAKAAAEPLVEIQIRFSDYSKENGIALPHHVSRTTDGQINEEWDLTKFKINPSIKADKFEKSK